MHSQTEGLGHLVQPYCVPEFSFLQGKCKFFIVTEYNEL